MATNGSHTTAMSFPLINCNSRNCLQNMFPLSTIWFSKWSHSSIVLKLGILRCSKHSKWWGMWRVFLYLPSPDLQIHSLTLLSFPDFLGAPPSLKVTTPSLPGISSLLPAHGWKFWTDISSDPGRGEGHRPKNSWKNTKACRSDCMAHFLLLNIYREQ